MHFHLLLFVGTSFGTVVELRRFISSSWYEVTGKASEGHLRAGTRVEAVRKWREVTSYVERYMAREEEFPEGLQTGRIWGIWNEREPTPRSLGDGRGQPQGRLQDQEDLQEACEKKR